MTGDKTEIAGVMVDNLSKGQALENIAEFVRSGRPHYIVTAYSEFVVFAKRLPEYKQALNEADLCLADGIGILWAAKYLSIPLSWPTRFLKFVQAIIQAKYSLLSLFFFPVFVRTAIKEQISGSRFVWDLAELCATQGFSLALVGGFDGVAEKAEECLKQKFPNLAVKLSISDINFDQGLVDMIAAADSDILLVAYQPPKQELWLKQNLDHLNVRMAMGVGGTFDYLASKRRPSPEIFVKLGLEWFWRLLTQPWRIKRIWNATVVFIWIIILYKVKNFKKSS